MNAALLVICGIALLCIAFVALARGLETKDRANHLQRQLDALTAQQLAHPAPEPFDPAVVAQLRKRDVCLFCGGWHDVKLNEKRACPRVKRLAFTSGGAVAEVEFWPWGSWPTEGTIFPHDLAVEPPAEP